MARYQNCYRGGEKTNYHAEQFLLEDTELAGHLEAAAATQHSDDAVVAAEVAAAGGAAAAAAAAEHRVVIFLTYQPCHFSGGHVKNIGKAVTTSCTNRLLVWSRAVLQVRYARYKSAAGTTYIHR